MTYTVTMENSGCACCNEKFAGTFGPYEAADAVGAITAYRLEGGWFRSNHETALLVHDGTSTERFLVGEPDRNEPTLPTWLRKVVRNRDGVVVCGWGKSDGGALHSNAASAKRP